MRFNFYDVLRKIVCFGLITACIGLPVLNIFSFIIIFISALAIVNGAAKHSSKRLVAAILIAICIVLIKGILPHAAIQEGHNLFFTKESNETLEKDLPADVYDFMKQQFLKRYPLDKRNNAAFPGSCWKQPVPNALFAYSADAALLKPKYSRIVDSVDFNDLTEFRGGFANDNEYNWFSASDVKRESMPFFVMYELSPACVNSSLCWTGHVLWEGAAGHYEAIYHKDRACRNITKNDIGKKIFGVAINNKEQMSFWGRFGILRSKVNAFFSGKKNIVPAEGNKETSLSMHLVLSPSLRISMIMKRILDILGALLIINLMIRIDRKRFLLACFMIALAAMIAYLYCPQLFGQYFIHEGGEDGMLHKTFAREILINAVSGNWLEALRGQEKVFWNTPGFRYFRALEKLFFGDTDLGYLAVVLILPYVLFGFLTSFVSKRWAFWATILFLFSVFLNSHAMEKIGFTYHIYVMVVRGGWPDTLAYTAFLGGLTLALRYVKIRDGSYIWYGFLAHFLFFVTVFMRPQFCFTALIAVLYFAVRLFREGRFKEVIYTWIGFVPVLFPLAHNYFFGGKLCLFTGAVNMALIMPPSVYVDAFKELLAADFSGQNIVKVTLHLKTMVGPWYRAILLGAVIYLTFLKRRVPSEMRMVAILCLSLHFVNLFIFAVYFRYVFLTWALTVISAIFLSYLWLGGEIKDTARERAGIIR